MNFNRLEIGRKDVVFKDRNHLSRLGTLFIADGGWRITIHSVFDFEDVANNLMADGGYAITHLGKIERVLGGSFTVGKAKSILEVIRLYLSFAHGAFVTLPISIGRKKSKLVWEKWSCHIVYTWRPYASWFDNSISADFERLFPNFIRLYRDAHWSESLPRILYWYLRSNNSSEAGVDGGLILAQAALETISWVYLVQISKSVSSRDFSNKRLWPTNRKIREVLSCMQIPYQLPNGLKDLRSAARRNNWPDGPTAIVSIRNDLVHPRQTNQYSGRSPRGDAWLLSQQYIELIILRLAGYEGRYVNKTSVNWHITRVPWP
jgi:hypothetical protein